MNGRTVRAKRRNGEARRCDSTGKLITGRSYYCVINEGDTGTVVSTGASSITVVYPPERGADDHRRLVHRNHNEGTTWEYVGSSPTATLTIEQQGVMELFLASSTETIDGVVPQVKYGKVIVWQGDPVDATDKTDDEVNTEACKVAQEKINEVVKKQFT